MQNLVEAFFIPKVEHLSTRINLFAHWHHLVKVYKKLIFFLISCDDISAIDELPPVNWFEHSTAFINWRTA